MCINYKTEDFVARVKEETGGKGLFSCINTPLMLEIRINFYFQLLSEKKNVLIYT